MLCSKPAELYPLYNAACDGGLELVLAEAVPKELVVPPVEPDVRDACGVARAPPSAVVPRAAAEAYVCCAQELWLKAGSAY